MTQQVQLLSGMRSNNCKYSYGCDPTGVIPIGCDDPTDVIPIGCDPTGVIPIGCDDPTGVIPIGCDPTGVILIRNAILQV